VSETKAARLTRLFCEEFPDMGHSSTEVLYWVKRYENVVEWQAALQNVVGAARVALKREGIEDHFVDVFMARLDEFSDIDSGRDRPHE
jgi:hypothetical protein